MLDPSARHLVDRLLAAGSDLGRQLYRARHQRLRDHLRSLVPAAADPNPHLLRLAVAVGRYLAARGERDTDEVCSHLLRRPVIQAADHANLLLDPETFLNNYLFHVATREAGGTVTIHSQCTTVSCLSRRTPPLGPTFLRTRGALLAVYPLSRTTLKDSSFCALPGPLEMTFGGLDGVPLDVAADPVLGPLLGQRAPDGPTGYRAANDRIWRGLDLDHGVRRVQIDESVAAECVARHLADPDGPVYRLLFDPYVRETFLRVKRRLVADQANLAVNRAAPDFLWYRKGSRLHQVVFVDGHPVLEATGAPLPVPYTPAAVARALRAGDLAADRVLAYLVRCLLPGVVAVGGTAQQDYVALYRRMVVEANAEAPFLTTGEVTRATRADLSRVGGRPLLELAGDALDLVRFLGPGSRLADLDDAYLDRPIGATVGALRSARHLEARLPVPRQHVSERLPACV
ncbi:hypothetical protein [Rhizomonospora bruguierae]|uniref:hypothetical protein n=1 Tax=Rhizomonospora bruguierae TaxID=1581705 RepID=UPI001BD11454|nr:hypothetical protein [Micromonospora sp. NBRC 107566]